MPRKADPLLEQAILRAARKLWTRGGEKALSLRAVARAAGTNTPAIYRRFRNRTEILRALVRAVQQELYETVKGCKSLREIAEATLDFGLAHPREYQLLTAGLLSRIGEPQPNLEFVKHRCAEWLGGTPEDHIRLVSALWCLVHGAAMLLITETVPREQAKEVRPALVRALDLLVREESLFRKPSRQER
jgi:AcrR family transcriptional regulator